MTPDDPPRGAPGPRGRRRAGGPALLAAVGLLTALAVPATPSAAAAQGGGAEEDGAADEPWLGVGLRQAVRCETRVEARPDGSVRQSEDSGCRRSYVAVAVVEDAPADRAGVQPGDTVVAVNGKALSRESGRVEVGALEAGRPAQLLIGRPGEGRLSVRVVPEPRPPRVEPERVRTAGAPPPVLRGSPGGDDDGVQAPQGEGAPVVFGRDEDGRVVVRWRDGDSARSARLREMSPRLEAIRDSVFAQARRHIRALREHQRQTLRRARERARAAAGEAGAAREEEVADALLRTESLRAAGAELRPLTSSLADYFPGAERGLLVMEVLAGTPAAELGLRPGDVVVEAGGRDVAGPADLREALEQYPDQDSLVVKWIRKGEATTGVLRRK